MTGKQAAADGLCSVCTHSKEEMVPIAASAVLLLPLLLCILRWAHQRRFTGGLISGPGSLPPGSMGWPLIGEMLDFLRYFKFAKRPDDFISKRKARGCRGVDVVWDGAPRRFGAAAAGVGLHLEGISRVLEGLHNWLEVNCRRLLGILDCDRLGNAVGRFYRYGDTGIYKSHLFGGPVIITCSPEFNRQVLSRMAEEETLSSGWPSNELLGSSSISVVDGFLHKRLRKHLMEAFTNPKALNSQLRIAQPIFISALENWVSKKRIVAYDETKTMTFHNICQVLVSFESMELLQKMERLYRGLMAGLRSLTINIPGTAYHHALKCRKQLTNILSLEMRTRQELGAQKHDFMQILMDSVDENGAKLREIEVVENIVSLILGGYESTSDVMMWGLYYLAKHPDILEKLKEEAKLVRERKHQRELLSIEDVKSMNYTSKVAEELIRLANVSPFIFRRVVKDNVLINGELLKASHFYYLHHTNVSTYRLLY
ncbi:Beta-amyrin 11-oxidase [Platanthera guangdongensis]|uniref:Beta-amyrin 11-oxidase n=1 Tax=Platanthera guangdongensis TaxID=2320717 RepID=A0ABR2LBY0_9ASPA